MYLWSHDTLNQMCDKRCKQWMQDNGYWERWIKPGLGLNDLIKIVGEDGVLIISKPYADHPVGN
jgi:hypothetical protein